MAKKHKTPVKMVIKLPETNNLNQQYINPIKSIKDYTIQNIKYIILNNKYIQLLLAITLGGFILRFYELGWNSLWLDEASTLTFATAGSFWDIWNLTVTAEPNPPLFHWLEYIMLHFGNNEFILRFIPALFGVFTIPIMYYIGKEFIDENGGIIAAAAFAISPFLIVYSQEARAYSMLLFFIALTTLFYLKAIKETGYKYWNLFAIASTFAFWTHFYAAIFVTALIIYTVVMYKLKYIKKIFVAGIILTITTLPLAIISIPVILKSKSGGPTFGFQGIDIITQTIIQLTGFNSIVTYIMLLLFICGITALFIKEREKSILLLWLLGFTFLTSLYLSYKIPMVPRYLIFLEIMFVMGIAASYKIFYTLTQHKSITYILIAIIVLLNVPFLSLYYSNYSKDDWRGFSLILSDSTQPGDSIIIVPGYIYQPLNYYYSNKTDNTIEYLVSNITDLQKARTLQTGSSYYIVTGDIQSADPSGNALTWINTNTKQIYRNNNIYVFKS